jgi:hypothetical protein
MPGTQRPDAVPDLRIILAMEEAMQGFRTFITAGLIAIAPLGSGIACAASVVLTATLTGANAVPPGDPDGSGKLTVEIDPEFGDFCYTLTADKVGKATGAHIHSGAAGASGDVEISIQVASDTCIAVEPSKLKPIVDKPEDFYVDVHTAANSTGAVRGQLAKK